MAASPQLQIWGLCIERPDIWGPQAQPDRSFPILRDSVPSPGPGTRLDMGRRGTWGGGQKGVQECNAMDTLVGGCRVSQRKAGGAPTPAAHLNGRIYLEARESSPLGLSPKTETPMD